MVVAAAQLPSVAMARDHHYRHRVRPLPLNDPRSLASPNYQGYRPAWANPYAQPCYLGVNNDPTPFNPADVDCGPSPSDPDEY